MTLLYHLMSISCTAPDIPLMDPSNPCDTQNFEKAFLDMKPVISDEIGEDDVQERERTDIVFADSEDLTAIPSPRVSHYLKALYATGRGTHLNLNFLSLSIACRGYTEWMRKMRRAVVRPHQTCQWTLKATPSNKRSSKTGSRLSGHRHPSLSGHLSPPSVSPTCRHPY